MAMGIDLPVIWAVIIGFGLMMYVVMDGFDLGIGILFPFIRDRSDRDTMVNTVAPVWDGNETWLVLGGAALMAAFPLAYSLLLSALYIPLFLMLAGLIWRGVAFEFRFKADETHSRSGTRPSAGAPTSRRSRKAPMACSAAPGSS
jgi:cytochrome d ubiquinol oxidase subunit II